MLQLVSTAPRHSKHTEGEGVVGRGTGFGSSAESEGRAGLGIGFGRLDNTVDSYG